MADFKAKPSNIVIKRALAAAGVLVLLSLALHVWFVNNARAVFKQYIAEQSRGKIKIELSRLDLNLWSNRLQIHEAELVSTDSLNEPITYHVSFSAISVKVGSIWDLWFHKKLLLDSLKLYNPVIKVIQWRKDTAQVVLKDELSIPQEMGKVYNSLLNALDEFAVRRIIIDNASISLINKMKPASEPVTVSRIFFDLARTPVRSGDRVAYTSKEQTIELRTSRQNIALPGGRHHISFKSFRLRLLRQSIELDSCTVTAMPTDSLKSNYRVFFKKLSLTGVDFAALSGKNVIKADTVYCENPFFDLNLYRADAVVKKTEIPDPNKIIRELTGNLDLALVVVKNAGIHFDIYSKTKRSFFNSNKDNFEIKGFRVNPDSSQPATIARFNMTLRDYRLYNEDSSSTIGFDSLHFLNDRVVLNNFALLSKPGKNRLRNLVDIKIPFFELSELDWYQLIFEQNLVAKEAVLDNPVINYTHTRTRMPGKKLDIFAALLNLDSLVALENVSVINGKVNGKLSDATSFNVQDIDFNIYSNKLLRSTNKEGLRRAVEHLSFAKGELQLKDLAVRLEHARYTGNNLIHANRIAILGKGDKIAATINDVTVDNLQLDDNADNIEVDGLLWQSATVALKAFPYGKGANSSNIHLKNVSGHNTQLSFSNGATAVATYLQTLHASSLLKEGDKPIHVEGFIVAGDDLLVKSNAVHLNAESYSVSGDGASSLNNLQMLRIIGSDTLSIRSSHIEFAADLNKVFANDQHLRYVHTTAPVIDLRKWNVSPAGQGYSAAPLPIRIDELTALAPDIRVAIHRNDSLSRINMPWSEKSIVQAQGITITGENLQIDSVLVKTTSATFSRPNGELVGFENGRIDIQLSDIAFGKMDGKIQWRGFINNLDLESAAGLQIRKVNHHLRLEKAAVGNLYLSSGLVKDLGQLLKANPTAWLHIPEGQYIDSNKTLHWYNVTYLNSSRTLRLDSFVYHPTRSLASVLAIAPYQLDYITVKTGEVRIAGLDVEQYEKDTSVIAENIKIDRPVLTVYRDKGPPYSPIKKLRPLPVNIIKNIKLPVSIRRIDFGNGSITYSEKNGKSGRQGDLLLINVGGTLENIRNTELLNGDSLSLIFRASLMDAAQVDVDLKESYSDSLSGFLLMASVSPATLRAFNPVLVPLLNIKIPSGLLDSARLHAIGREDLALGEMKLHYRKLRVGFVKDGMHNRSTILQRLTGYFANTFVIKGSNMKRIGVIFSKRSGDQSFINYIVRMSLSGIMSSIGVRKNRNYIKQYKQELKDSGLPSIEL